MDVTFSVSTRIKAQRRAFTLIESMVASVVLAIAVIGISATLTASYQQTLYMRETATGVGLARQLLEEIAAQPYTGSSSIVSSPTAGSRSAFSGAGAYNLYTDTSSSIGTLAGGTISDTADGVFTRSVSITSGAKPSSDTASSSGDFALVIVTVTTPSGLTVQLQRVMTNHGFSR